MGTLRKIEQYSQFKIELLILILSEEEEKKKAVCYMP